MWTAHFLAHASYSKAIWPCLAANWVNTIYYSFEIRVRYELKNRIWSKTRIVAIASGYYLTENRSREQTRDAKRAGKQRSHVDAHLTSRKCQSRFPSQRAAARACHARTSTKTSLARACTHVLVPRVCSIAPITDVRWHVPHDESEAIQPAIYPRVQRTLRTLLETE